MPRRDTVAEQFARNMREAEAMERAIAALGSTMDDLIATTRESITESRRLMERVEALLLAR